MSKIICPYCKGELEIKLEKLEPVTMPEFDPEDLMTHEWKGRKLGPREYAVGSLEWGWDFREKFAPETIMALENGPISIDKYEFTLTDRLIQAKKKGK